MIVGLVIGIVVGAGCGVVIAWTLAAARAAARAGVERARQAEALGSARAEAAALQVALDLERGAAQERRTESDDVRRQLVGEFAELSRQALEQNNSQFLELADARLAHAQQSARGDLDQRTQAIEQLLTPLREQLGRYEEGLRLLELERQKAYTGLTEQVRSLGQSQDKLQSETRNLVTALRSPATRGRWGEMQLRRVVEMAGMVEHCDFEQQVSTEGSDGRIRPDMVVTLPGARQVVVDAKVPLQAFLDANDATDEADRRAQLVVHARHLRAHVDSLSKKAYWEQFENSPEYVVAFIPGDALLAAALEHDSSLLEHAVSHRVLLATPTTLIALLRTIASGWQQEALAENAREVQDMGRELYKRLATFGEHMARTGRSLSGAVDSYNKAVGSLERNVFPQARRFHDLGVVGGADKEMPELEPVDATARALEAPEFARTKRGLLGESGLELIEGSRSDDRELPGKAVP
ncbi:MAG TPA: DNA recombination protein RmuC [Acidimicrobiales bacterium]|nr:DNA recombination protein RmuC [Acidimicrobiales bacterium]